MPRIVGNYELSARIGAGGMGEVWRARHLGLDRPVAVKLIGGGVSASDRGVVDRFLREARAAATLRSPHAIRVHDLGVTEDGTFFQAMELLDGWDLQALVERTGPLPPGRVVALLRQACDALAEAHGHGLVHRDVKPSNLFLTRGGTAVDRLVVLDFGLARDAAGDGLLTQTGAMLGSPAYLAPELIRGGAATPAADVYGLGAVAWWLLTGRLVFEARSALELVVGHLEREPGLLPPHVPDGLAAAVRACLAKDPTARPDARGLSSRLGALGLAWAEDDAEAWWAAHPLPAASLPASTASTARPAPSRAGARAPPIAPSVAPSPGAPSPTLGTPPGAPPRGDLRNEREQAYTALRRHFEASRIDLGEMERRMARVGAAPDPAAVQAVLDGLGPAELPAPPPAPPPAPAPTALAPTTRIEGPPLITLFGHNDRKGPWVPAPYTRVITVCGGTDLDFREVTLAPGVTEVRCIAVFGGMQIIVPPDMRVEVAGFAIAGGFPSTAARDGDGPLLRITGIAVFGGVDVEVKARKGKNTFAKAAIETAAEVGAMVDEIAEAFGKKRKRRKDRKD